jgi:hypothetical protein
MRVRVLGGDYLFFQGDPQLLAAGRREGQMF